MKKILKLAGLGVVVVVVLAFAVVTVFMNSIIKEGVERAGPQYAKVSLKLDRAKVSLFSGSGGIYGLDIGNPEGFKTDYAFKMKETTISLKPMSLLSDKIVVNSIHVISPEINFEGGLKGNNLSKIAANIEDSLGLGKKSENQAQAPPAAVKPGKKIEVDDFLLSGAKVTLSLTELGGKPVSVTLPDIHLTGLGQSGEGITPGELVQKIVRVILDSTTQVAATQISGLATGVLGTNKETTEAVKKTTQGITDLFKKK
jgi:uncharacterized protein involved in outer membrane biogenesis